MKWLIALYLILSACAQIPGKKVPEYKGVSPKVQPILDEYMYLSKQNNITFYNEVSIGFKNVDYKNVIGVCNYGSFFREIDIDASYWSHATNTSKMALLFHELSHCYCYRNHDFDGKQYPDSELKRRFLEITYFVFKTVPQSGFFDDDCPKSLMYPIVVEDSCFRSHYAEYTKEMFENCKPY